MKNTTKQMIRKYFMVCVLISLIFAAFGQVSYNTQRQLIYVRTSTTHLAKPPASQLADNIWGLNTTDSVLYKLVDGVVVPAEHYYRYSTGKKNVVTDVTNAVTASYSTTKKMYYYLENSIAGNMPVSADFPTSIYRCVNTHDSLEYDKYSGVIRKYAIRYPYNPYKQASAELYDIYVSVLGNDTTGDGSISKPYRSPYKASVVAQSWDKILIKGGVYAENRKCSFPIFVSVFGEGKTKTKIYTNYATGTNGFAEALFIFKSSTLNTVGNQSVSGIGFYGNNKSYNAICVYYRGNVTIQDCHFENFLCRGTLFFGIAYESYREPAVYNSGNKFINNTVANCGSYSISYSAGLYIFGQENVTITGNKMYNFKGDQLGVKCIYSSTNRRMNIQNNSFRTIGRTSQNWNFCVEIRWNYGEINFSNNSTVGTIDLCYMFKQGLAYGAKVSGNIIGPATRDTASSIGLEFEGDYLGITVSNNYFRNTNFGLVSSANINRACVMDSLAVFKNTFDDIGTPNTRYVGGAINIAATTTYSAVPQWRRVFIDNNTFKSSGFTVAAIWLQVKGYYDDFKIRNNVFYDYDYSYLYIERTNGQTMAVDSILLSNNCYYSNGNNNNPKLVNITPTNLTNYNNITTDPLFVSTTNYNLQNSSPCKGTGINLGYGLNIGAY